jgi:hypothetical protein
MRCHGRVIDCSHERFFMVKMLTGVVEHLYCTVRLACLMACFEKGIRKAKELLMLSIDVGIPDAVAIPPMESHTEPSELCVASVH